MLNIELDNTEAIQREQEKAKHRKRRINKRKYNHKVNDLKYIKSNRHGLININTGKRMYKTKKNQLLQKATNKKMRQNDLKIKIEILNNNQMESDYFLNISMKKPNIDLLTVLNRADHKKIKTKNSFNGDKDIWKEPWLIYKPVDVSNIPKFNSKRNEEGQKPIERKVGA